MNRSVESVVNNIGNYPLQYFLHKGKVLGGTIIGIDCKDMNDPDTLYLYLLVGRKKYKVSYYNVYGQPEWALNGGKG